MQLQPKKQPIRRSSNLERVSFSPIKLEDPHPPPGVNLTGVPRRIRDRCADIYNTRGKWQKVKLRGARLIKGIATRQNESPQQADLFDLCDNLLKIVEDLAKLVDILKNVHENFDALVKINGLTSNSDLLEKERIGDSATQSTCSDWIPFVNFTLEDYATMARDIEAAYRNELNFKKTLITKIPNQTSAGVFTFASICWMNDTHIDEKVDSMVLALVAECGFE